MASGWARYSDTGASRCQRGFGYRPSPKHVPPCASRGRLTVRGFRTEGVFIRSWTGASRRQPLGAGMQAFSPATRTGRVAICGAWAACSGGATTQQNQPRRRAGHSAKFRRRPARGSRHWHQNFSKRMIVSVPGTFRENSSGESSRFLAVIHGTTHSANGARAELFAISNRLALGATTLMRNRFWDRIVLYTAHSVSG